MASVSFEAFVYVGQQSQLPVGHAYLEYRGRAEQRQVQQWQPGVPAGLFKTTSDIQQRACRLSLQCVSRFESSNRHANKDYVTQRECIINDSSS